METESHYQNNALAVFTESDSPYSKELIRKMADEHYDFLLNTSVDTTEISALLDGFDSEVYMSNADLSEYNGIEEFYREILSLGRPVDTLVISPRFLLRTEISPKENLRDQFNLIRSNTLAPIHLINKILGDMQERQKGKIIFTLNGNNHQLASHHKLMDASRAFLKSYGEALKNELKDSGIEVVISEHESVLNFGVRKKLQELASRYLPDWPH